MPLATNVGLSVIAKVQRIRMTKGTHSGFLEEFCYQMNYEVFI